ncbi:MAG TPA: S1/P1 nuclease [Anaeromyxobacter sp.]|nr:S1/P1 nuclease [Anaeromyxobacter sp.]
MTRRPALAAALVALLAPSLTRAWSTAGHEVVGTIAEARLSPPARALVREIAGDVPLSAPELGSWADWIRDRDTGPWHYVNIPFESGRYTPARDCPRGACAVAAIARQEAILRDPRASAMARADALRWLVHLVADLHQPLHAGDGRDRGGNELRVRLRDGRDETDLHRVWDVEVISAVVARRGPQRAAREILDRVSHAQAALWAGALDPAAWAEESNREARALYAELGRSPDDRDLQPLTPPDYARAQRPRTEAALARAGIRLAALLDRIAAARTGRDERLR